MTYFNQLQDRHSVLIKTAIPYESFYISSPPAQPTAMLYQLNRAGALPHFPTQFLIRRDSAYPYTAVICVTEGRGSVVMGEEEYLLLPNQVIILPAYTEYVYHSSEEDPLSIVWAEFCGGDSERMVQYLLDYNGPVFNGPVYSDLMQACLDLVDPPKAHRAIWISRTLYEILLRLHEVCRDRPIQQEENIYQILDYIDQHLGGDLSLNQMAQMFGYNPSYFSKFFYRNTGAHFSKYLLQRKLDRSRQLLLSTTMPLEQLAKSVGFYDASHFIRKFRESEGISPSRYRKQHIVPALEKTEENTSEPNTDK